MNEGETVAPRVDMGEGGMHHGWRKGQRGGYVSQALWSA